MAPQHPPRFLKIVEDAKTRVRETTVDEVKKRMDRARQVVLGKFALLADVNQNKLIAAVHALFDFIDGGFADPGLGIFNDL